MFGTPVKTCRIEVAERSRLLVYMSPRVSLDCADEIDYKGGYLSGASSASSQGTHQLHRQ
jgi:hypothetical protein